MNNVINKMCYYKCRKVTIFKIKQKRINIHNMTEKMKMINDSFKGEGPGLE